MQEDAHSIAQMYFHHFLKWNAHYAHEVQIALDSPYYSIGWGFLCYTAKTELHVLQKSWNSSVFLSETEIYNVMWTCWHMIYCSTLFLGKCILRFPHDVRARYCVTWRRQNCTCLGSTYTLSILHCWISKYDVFPNTLYFQIRCISKYTVFSNMLSQHNTALLCFQIHPNSSNPQTSLFYKTGF